MNREIRICIKMIIVIAVSILFMVLVKNDMVKQSKKQPEGERIRKEDVVIIFETVSNLLGNESAWKEWVNSEDANRMLAEENQELTYKEYRLILDKMNVSEELITAYCFEDKYVPEYYLLKEDFYRFFDAWVIELNLSEKIHKESVTVLISREEAANQLITLDGTEVVCHSSELKELCFTEAVIYSFLPDNGPKEFLTLYRKGDGAFTLPFTWVIQKTEDKVAFFWNNRELKYSGESVRKNEDAKEVIASLTFSKGNLKKIEYYTEKISGKLLNRSAKELTVDGAGTFLLHPEVQIYNLYEKMQTVPLEQLPIGYEFADFVLKDEKICGILMTAEDQMEKIRVAIKDSDFDTLYHNEIRISCDSDATFYYGSLKEPEEMLLKAGEELVIGEDEKYGNSERLLLVPKVHSAKITLHHLNRNKIPVSVRGTVEVLNNGEGYVLINELYLEEYLYSVVPSEMPASYPSEALKAQSVAARTYAFQYLKNPGYPQLGAHVDDSVSFQVYNNIEEHQASTNAVKETKGELLFYEENPITPYYYSTSCGMGSDARVWSKDGKEKFPYLSAGMIEPGRSGQTHTGEEFFREFILSESEDDFEYEIPWYRWTYEVKEFSAELLSERLKARYLAASHQILRKQEDGTYISCEPEAFSKVYQMTPVKRLEGGVIDELELSTDAGTYLIISEYNIRYILTQGGEIVLKNEDKVPCAGLLPSAYFVIDLEKDKEKVTGFRLSGGGYGHGVGMSQNAAKQMAAQGYSYQEILQFFYNDSIIKQLYRE